MDLIILFTVFDMDDCRTLTIISGTLIANPIGIYFRTEFLKLIQLILFKISLDSRTSPKLLIKTTIFFY